MPKDERDKEQEQLQSAFSLNKTRAEFLSLVKQILYESKPERVRKLVAQLKHTSQKSGVSAEKELKYLCDFYGEKDIEAIVPAPPTDTYYNYLKAADLQDTLRKGEIVEQLNVKLTALVKEGPVEKNLPKWNAFVQELMAGFESRKAGTLYQIAYRYLSKAGFTVQIVPKGAVKI